MWIDMVSVPARPGVPNEDYVAAATGAEGAVVVVDGVTPPPDGVSGCHHGVPWFAGRLGGSLLEMASIRRDRTLADCLAEGIARTRAAHGTTCDLTRPLTPQATVAALRWDAEQVEYLVLADSVVLLDTVDGGVTPVLDTRLDDSRKRPDVRARLAAVRAAVPGTEEHAAAVRAMRATAEALRNAEGGFFTAAADPGVASRAVTGTVPRASLRSVAALTDGATRWSEVFRFGDWPELLATLRAKGARALVEAVRAAETADPDRTAFPRGKAHDDASVVYADLTPS